MKYISATLTALEAKGLGMRNGFIQGLAHSAAGSRRDIVLELIRRLEEEGASEACIFFAFANAVDHEADERCTGNRRYLQILGKLPDETDPGFKAVDTVLDGIYDRKRYEIAEEWGKREFAVLIRDCPNTALRLWSQGREEFMRLTK